MCTKMYKNQQQYLSLINISPLWNFLKWHTLLQFTQNNSSLREKIAEAALKFYWCRSFAMKHQPLIKACECPIFNLIKQLHNLLSFLINNYLASCDKSWEQKVSLNCTKQLAHLQADQGAGKCFLWEFDNLAYQPQVRNHLFGFLKPNHFKN